MKICPACKAENENTAKFCLVCGRLLSGAEIIEDPAPEEPAAAPGETPFEEPVREEIPVEEDKEEPVFEEPAAEEPAEPAEPEVTAEEPEEPAAGEPAQKESAPEKKARGTLTTGQYFLLEGLFAIPVIGTVCLFIFSLSHPKNDSLRRFSSSVLIWRLILYLIAFIVLALMLFRFKEWAPKIMEQMRSFDGMLLN